MKRVAIALFLLFALVLAVVAWIGEISITGDRRELVENLLSRAFGSLVRFEGLKVSVTPLIVDASKLSFGDKGIAEIGHLTIRMFPFASIREGRPVVVVKVESPMIDLTQLPHDDEDVGEIPWPLLVAAIPPLRVSEFSARDVRFRFRMGKEAVDVVAESLYGSLQRSLLRRNIDATMELKGGAWRRREFGFRVDTLNLAGGADAQGVWLDRAAADGPDLTLRVSASKVAHSQDGVATFNTAMLGAFVDELALIGGEARVEGKLSGDIIDPIVDAQLTVQHGSLAQRPIGDLSARFTRKRSRLAFEDVRIDGEVGSAAGAVQLVVYHEVPIQADLAWERIDLEKLLDLVGTELPFQDLLEGHTLLAGTLDPLDLRVKGSGSAQPRALEHATQIAAWNASTRILAHSFEGHAQLEQVGNQVTAELSIAKDLAGRMTATIVKLDALSGLLPEPIPQLGLSGVGNVSAELRGTVDAPTVHADLQVAEAAVGGTPVNELNGTVSIAAGHLTTPSLRFAAGGGNGVLSGTVALTKSARNDWELGLHAVDTNLVVGVTGKFIGLALPVQDGELTASVVCSGTWPSARIEAEVSGQALQIYGEPFESASAKVAAPLPSWSGQVEFHHVAAEVITAKASGKSLDSVDLSFASEPFRLAGIERLARPEVRGSIQAKGRVFGPWRDLAGKIEVSGKGLAQPAHVLGDVEIVATGQQGRWSAQANALHGQVVADATLRSLPPFAYTLTARLRDANLSSLLLGTSPSQVTLSGDVSISGDLNDIAHPNGSARVSDFRLHRDVHVVEEASPFLFDLTRGRLVIRSLALRNEANRIDVSGEASTAGDLRVEARGQGDLVLLELFELPIAAARGPFSIRVGAAYSPLTGWKLDGEGRAQDAIVDLGLPVAFTRTAVTVVLHDDEIRIEQLEGRAGGGQFLLSGTINLEKGPAIAWKAQEVGFSAAEGLELKVTGAGKLDGTWDRPALSGSVEVINALYDRNFDWSDVLPWLLEQLSGRNLQNVRRSAHPISLGLIVYSRGGVFVDNNLANLETWLDMQILGDTSAPVISGRIGFLDGEVFLRGRKFSITGGTVDFRDNHRNDPVLNISAEGRVVSPDTDYGLTMIVSGTASNPRIQFSASDPTLSQSDVFSLATFGKTSAQLQREGSGVSAADALALVPTGEVEKRVGQLVGFDRFQVEALQSRSTGAIEPRVTIGKDLTEQLRALAWTSFGVESRRAVQLEYRVTRRVSLLGAWESDTRSGAGAFGGDIKFRYEFRRMPFSLLGEVFPSLF